MWYTITYEYGEKKKGVPQLAKYKKDDGVPF